MYSMSSLHFPLSKMPSSQNATSRLFSSPRHISRLDRRVLKFSVADSLDLLPVLFALHTWTRQDSLVLSVSTM